MPHILGTTLTSGRAVNQDAAERLHADLAAMAGVTGPTTGSPPDPARAREGQSGPAFHDARARLARALALSMDPSAIAQLGFQKHRASRRR